MAPSKSTPHLDRFVAAKIDTMDKCFDYAVSCFSHQRMVGTRQVLKEEDEEQPNGKVFKKWVMGDYNWRTYVDVDADSTNFGKGLRELGENVCLCC